MEEAALVEVGEVTSGLATPAWEEEQGRVVAARLLANPALLLTLIETLGPALTHQKVEVSNPGCLVSESSLPPSVSRTKKFL